MTAAFIRSPKVELAAETEAAVRVQLAACYRLLAHFGMDDWIFTHVAARIPGKPDQFLLNPYGLMYDEITASSLVKVDNAGTVHDSNGYPLNAFGFDLHQTLLGGRPKVGCSLHTHTRAGIAVSALAEGLLPMSQFALQFYDDIAYHPYEGNGFLPEERKRLIAGSAGKRILFLRNHGIVTLGRSVPEAFFLAYYLEQSCRIQIDALAMAANRGRNAEAIILPPGEISAAMGRQYRTATYGELAWPALLRMLDRKDASYRD